MDEVEELLPGWYRQQTDPTHLRWWDGHAWTDDVLPAEVLDDDALEEELEDQIRAHPEPAPVEDDEEFRPRRLEPLRPEGSATPARSAPRSASQDRGASGDLGEQARRFAGTFGDRTATIRIDEDERTPPGSGTRRAPASGSIAPRRAPGARPAARPAPRERGSARSAAAGRSGSTPGPDGRRAPGGRPRPPVRRPGSPRGRYATGNGPHVGRFALRLVLAAAVALLGYVLLRPFITDPSDARTIAGEPRPTTTVAADGTVNGRPPLSEAVLTLNDLPAGWSSQAELTSTRVGFCGGRNPLATIVPVEEHRSTFSKTTNGPFLSQVAVRYRSSEEADRFLDLVAETLETCRTYEDGGATFFLEPLEFPDFGDDTFAAHVTGESPLGPLDGDVVWVRRADRLVSLSTIAFGDLDVDLLELLTEAVVRRL
jgi:hypothetical protein